MGFMKVELMINAVINQFFIKTLNVQFHPDVGYGANYTLGMKRPVLEKIFDHLERSDDVDKFFGDLDRLIAIRKYYADRRSGTSFLRSADSVLPDYGRADGPVAFERLHRDFMLTAADIEAQLVQILGILCDF
jgi:hypothetical protein